MINTLVEQLEMVSLAPELYGSSNAGLCGEAKRRIEELERQLVTRTVAATKLALEVAAKVAETMPSNTGMYLDRRDIAAAIRALASTEGEQK